MFYKTWMFLKIIFLHYLYDNFEFDFLKSLSYVSVKNIITDFKLWVQICFSTQYKSWEMLKNALGHWLREHK